MATRTIAIGMRCISYASIFFQNPEPSPSASSANRPIKMAKNKESTLDV
jgi:hypothetical protein